LKDLSEDARQARNAYLREWRKKNAEKHAEYQRRYWEKRAQMRRAERLARVNFQGLEEALDYRKDFNINDPTPRQAVNRIIAEQRHRKGGE